MLLWNESLLALLSYSGWSLESNVQRELDPDV